MAQLVFKTDSRSLRHRHLRSVAIFSGLALVIFPAASGTAQWTARATFDQSVSYDDNIFLSDVSPIATFGLEVAPTLYLEGRTPDWSLDLSARPSYSAFSDNAVRDSFDQDFRLGVVHQSRRSLIGADMEFDRQTTRTSETLDTGRVSANARRTRVRAAPYWTVEISPVDRVTLGTDVTDVSYDTDRLSDYTTYGMRAVWARQLTMRDELNLAVAGSRFNAHDRSDLVSHLASTKATITHMFSEQLEARLGAGVRYVRSDFRQAAGPVLVDRRTSSVGYLLDAGVSYRQSEQMQFRAGYSRSIEPSGTGSLSERDSIDVSMIYRLTETLTTDLAARLLLSNNADSSGGNGRRYYEIEPRLQWELLPDWYLATAYRYRTQDVDNPLSRAVSNSVNMSLTYKTPLW